MSLQEFYGKRFRHHTGYHPVWTPGSAIEPGDYGVLQDRVFVREGHVRQLATQPRFEVTRRELGEPQHFNEGVHLDVDAAVKAQADPAARVEATARFHASGGIAYDAQGLTQARVDDVRGLLRALPWNSDIWEQAVVLVTEVILAERAAIMLAEGGGGEARISGRASALQALDIADASVGIAGGSAATFTQSLGGSGGPFPVALRLYQWRWWRAAPRLLGADPPEPFGELPPRLLDA